MHLDDETTLKEHYIQLCDNNFTYRGYSCYLFDSLSGYGGMYFFKSKKEIKKYLPVLLNIYSIIHDDFSLNTEEEVIKMKHLIQIYRNSKWEKDDFENFIIDSKYLIGYEIGFFVKNNELFNLYSENCNIQRIQNNFRVDIFLNKQKYIDYLNNLYD